MIMEIIFLRVEKILEQIFCPSLFNLLDAKRHASIRFSIVIPEMDRIKMKRLLKEKDQRWKRSMIQDEREGERKKSLQRLTRS